MTNVFYLTFLNVLKNLFPRFYVFNVFFQILFWNVFFTFMSKIMYAEIELKVEFEVKQKLIKT